MKYYHIIELILDFIASIFWPLITIIIFLILKEPIKTLINNIKKIGYGGTALETNLVDDQNNDTSILELLGDGNDESYLDNALGMYSNVSIKQAEEIIEKETKISEVDGYQNKLERLQKYSKLLVMFKSFERVYDSIFGSQIRFLQRLNHTSVESKTSLKLYYDNASKNYPEAYKSYTYDRYLKYLHRNGLIIMEENDENIQITFFGKDFLRYLIEANLSLEKLY
ncbi:hypothetical protein CLV91_2623 [Maribacter vaceletii]|uniref:Uncharacterized protein n=1 Tax=Maribacter vaceletii TaxID=1206816 RepID=A0A495E748_9FLAO|nr:hypothetical protein [Maribacter vaceletii]RKR12491.1 hypothetical protein CLV91_2623 [Maribacter vaceletii]